MPKPWNPDDALAAVSQATDILTKAGAPVNLLTVRAYIRDCQQKRFEAEREFLHEILGEEGE